LQVWQRLKFADIVHVANLVAVQVQHLELWEFEYFVLDFSKVVVAQVKPLKVLLVPHDFLEHLEKSSDFSQVVVMQEHRASLPLDDKSFLSLTFCIVCFPSWSNGGFVGV
jgi:hypothetical protein